MRPPAAVHAIPVARLNRRSAVWMRTVMALAVVALAAGVASAGGNAVASSPPTQDYFRAVTVTWGQSQIHLCGLEANGKLVCWGEDVGASPIRRQVRSRD